QTTVKNLVNGTNAGGKLKLVDLNQEIISGNSIPLFSDYNYTLKTLETGFPVSNPVNLRHHWNNDNTNYNQTEVFLADGTPQSANFKESYLATIESRIEGVLPVFTNFSDPWVTGGIGLTDKVSGTRKVFPNEEKLQSDPNKPYYLVKADQVLTFAGDQTAQFQNWKTTGTDQLTNSGSTELQPVVFRSANATVFANYKSKLKTGQPANANSKNQRRLAVNGNTQLLVYESMSDIWVTASFDDGTTWLPEKRVTKRTGYAANPSLSALLTSGSNKKGLVTWSEVNTSGQTETYLQSITLSAGQLYFGWASLVLAPVDNTNRRKLNDFGFSTLPQAGVAPTLSLSGSTVVITYKGTNAYLIGGKFTIGADLNSISGLVSRTLTTESTSKQANVIHLDANSGFGAKDFVYYAKSNGSSEPVYQYDWDAQTTLQCDIPTPTGTGQYSCESLQASGTNGTVTFVYQGAVSSGPDVLYYVKAGYNDRPVLSVRYLKGEKPAVTDQATSAYSVTGRLVFRSTDPANSGNWFSVVGSGSATSIGGMAVGMYTRDQGTGSSFMFTSNETPLASVKRYTGSGQLMKGDGGIQMNYTFNRWWVDQNGVKHPVVLDFTGVTVEPEGSMEQGNVICAVKVVNPSDEEILVSQPDTLVNNLAISIFRNGQVIRAYKPTVWSEISTQSLTGLMADDILLFSVPETVTFSLGFTDVELKPVDGMNKRNTKEKSKVDLAAVTNEVVVYPNPFNPVTTLTVSINTPSMVSIKVYNILGQVVADFGKNQMDAGKHSVRFDGHNFASGTYFYRVEIGNEVKTGKLQLLK
ncbi:MAG: T9SS type A sorting domain-containing protein, partial [Bacteroidetes bacterium]|nr:T9SS type A sorting domain-containing protein [Bacteroidota bacterium]